MNTQVSVVENGVRVAVTGTLPVTAAQLAALNAADAPGASNPLLTESAGDARYQATPITDGDLPSTIARDTEVTAAIGAHAGAADPHGDRAYVSGVMGNHESDDEAHSAINSRFDQAGTAASEVSTHNSSSAAHANIRSGVVVSLSKPSLISWSWVNQGAGVRHDAADHISLVVESSGGTTTYLMRALEAALADSGSFEVTACLKNLASTTINPWGLYVRNDSIVYATGALNALGLKVDSRTAMSGVAPTSIYNGNGSLAQPLWLRISRVGNDLLIYVSLDGQAWALFRTIVDAALVPMTACGFYNEIRATSGMGIIECDSFSIVT